MTNREAWHEGYVAGFKGLHPRPDYEKVGLAGSYRLGYEAGAKRRKDPKGKRQAKNARVFNPTISGLKGELLQVDRDIADLESDPFYKETPGRRVYRAKWLAYHRRQRRNLEALLKSVERAAKRRNNGIVEAAAGLQALEYIGAKAKRSGLGRKAKYNPGETRYLIQVIKAKGGREQFTTNSAKEARETAASWYSRGASVTIVDRKNKTQTVYGAKKNPRAKTESELLAMQLTAQRAQAKAEAAKQRYGYGSVKHLQAETAYKTASQRYQRAKARAQNPRAKGGFGVLIANIAPYTHETAKPGEYKVTVWRVRGGRRFFSAATVHPNKEAAENYVKKKGLRVENPRAKGSRDALGVWHAENPGKTSAQKKAIIKALRHHTSEHLRQVVRLNDDADIKAIAKAILVKRTKRSPSGKDHTKNPSVTDLSHTFQGDADGSIDRLFAADGAPANLARAGKLVFLKVKGRTFRLPGAVVAIAPNEKLWITGKPPLFTTKARKGEGLDVGEVTHICYETAKAHIGDGKTFEYVHEFGEDGGRRPHLIIDHEGMPILRGGDYKIRAEGIVN